MATVRVKVDTSKLQKSLEKVVPKINKASKKALPELVKENIKRGVSPVKGVGRFQKYSENYRATIKGERGFRTSKHGGVYPIESVSNKELRAYRASKEARKQNRGLKKLIKGETAKYNKRVSPVNMTLSGKMVASLKAKIVGGFLTLSFFDEKAEYHNEGTKTIPRRPLLPTKEGEKFNRSITLRLQGIATKVFKKF